MKAVLVIEEMPKGCCECNFAIDLCHGTIPKQEWYNRRPSWCPLKPMPNDYPPYGKIRHQNFYTEEEFDAYEKGWNACLDEITGETEYKGNECPCQYESDLACMTCEGITGETE